MTDRNGLEHSDELPIMDGVVMELTGVTGGQVRVTVYYTLGEDREVLYSSKHSTDFYEDRTQRGTIKNDVADALDGTPLDGDDWATAWKQVASEMVSKKEEQQAKFVPANVQMLAEGTEWVKTKRAGDTRIYNVKIDWNGRTETLEFDHTELASNGTTPLKEKCVLHFAKQPDIEPEDWQSLKDYWLDIQQETPGETLTETDRAVEEFIETLAHRVRPNAEPQVLTNGKEAAWVDWENEHQLNLNGDASPRGVVWVQGSLVNDILNDMDNAPTVGTLAKELSDRDWTVKKSSKLQPAPEARKRYWFFDADALDITEMDVHEPGTESENGAPGGVDA